MILALTCLFPSTAVPVFNRFYPGIASPTVGLPAIGPGSGIVADAISGPRPAPSSNDYSTTTTDFEDDDKGVYELGPDTAKMIEEMREQEHGTPESLAARKKATLAALKRVPKIVGSIDHAIMPMAPVSAP